MSTGSISKVFKIRACRGAKKCDTRIFYYRIDACASYLRSSPVFSNISTSSIYALVVSITVEPILLLRLSLDRAAVWRG